MGLFGRNKQTTEQIEALQAELAAMRERIDGADAGKAQLELQIGALRDENTRLRDELLVQITSSANASNEATRTLAEQTAAHLDEQRARLADLAVVATDAAERAAAAGEVDPATEARLAEIERLANEAAAGAAQATSIANEAASGAAEATSAADDAAAQAAGANDRIGTVDARLTQVATELANQLSELSNELDAAAERAASADDEPASESPVADQVAAIDPELIDELLDAQDRLAAEQARYQIAFRQDLADLADRLKRQR